MDLEQTITHDDMRADAERAINGPGASLFMLGHHVLALLAENARLQTEVDQYVAVVEGGKRLPAPDLNQNPGFAAMVLGNLEAENARLREALTWAVGFIQCQMPATSAKYPDMRNAQDLVSAAPLHSGEFQRTVTRFEMAEYESQCLREALQPFAQGHLYAEEELRHLPDVGACALNPYDPDRSPKVRDCRRAAELLAPTTGGEGK